MKQRLALLFVLALATPAFAKDLYLGVAGSVGSFRTDARIFNPSQSKDIQVQAWFLPVGNVDNSGVQPVTINVTKRQMAIYNDVVSSLFHASGLGGVRLSSADDFVVTERVYSTSTTACGTSPINPCTLGQGITGIDSTAALKNGLLIQLSNGASTDKYRSNIVVLNPNNVAANVVWRVYDKTNAVAGNPKTITMPPYAVLGPNSMTSFGDSIPSTADLTDSWVGFTSDQPIVAWASVNDNASTDSTAIPAFTDSDPPTTTGATAKEFAVQLKSSQIIITPAPTGLSVGDHVVFHITATDPKHGFELVDPTGNTIVPGDGPYAVNVTKDKSFTIGIQGVWGYFCSETNCSDGHDAMVGTFTVGTAKGDPPPKY